MSALDNPDVELCNEGFRLWQSGDLEAGLELTRKAAFNGQPNAISNYNWHLLLVGRFEEAISFTEKLVPVAIKWIEDEEKRLSKKWGLSKNDKAMFINGYLFQIYNMQSNAAIAYLATGNEKEALELWDEAASKSGHLEARFYPIFHQGQKSPELMLRLLSKEFSKDEVLDLLNTMIDVSKTASGWFATWAKEGLKILQQAYKKSVPVDNVGGISNVAASSAATLGAGYVGSKLAREYMQNEIQDSSEVEEGAFDWLGDFFS
jgi:hypothetical protein